MIRTAALMAAAALALGACGDGDEPSASTTTMASATSTTAAVPATVDYGAAGESRSLGEGLVEAAAPDGSAFYVLDEDPAFSEPGCEGQPEPVMFRVPLDGGDRVRLGTAAEPVRGRLVQGPGDRIAVVNECEEFLQDLRVGSETADGRLEGLRLVPMDEEDPGLRRPIISAWNAAGDALLAGGVGSSTGNGLVTSIDPTSGAVTRLFDTGPGGAPFQVAQLVDGTYVVAADGQVTFRSASGQVGPKTPGAAFELFADGQRVLVFGEVLSVLTPGSPATTLIPMRPGRFIAPAAVSPDGRAAAYAFNSGEQTQIAVIETIGGDPVVVDQPDRLGRPTFSGDGRALAFSRSEREAPFATEVLVARFETG